MARTSARKEALLAGAKQYIGSPCAKAHDGLRTTSNGVCIQCGREKSKKFYRDNRSARLAYAAAYARRPDVAEARRVRVRTEEGRAKNRESVRRQRMTPKGAISHRVRSRIRASLKGLRLGSGCIEALGYTVTELKIHLERQFVTGMSWDNMGDWHIDHIIPLKMFTYTSINDDDFKAAWSLSNIRPLWSNENMKKHARREFLL